MRLNVIKIATIKQKAGELCGDRLLVRQQGFTLVELITIIVLLGILAAVAAPRFFERSVFDSRGFNDQVMATLRYAQKAAIAQRRFVCVDFTANSVALRYGPTNACTLGALTGPSGGVYSVTSNNASFSPVPAGFSFDCLGRPRDVTTAATCGDTAGVLTIAPTISVATYGTSITVERETGYVH